MAVVRFTPDPDGLARLQVESERETVRPLTEAIYDDSQRFVPVLSGDLRLSGRIEYGTDGHGLVIYGDEDVDYAIYQERGTSKMAAQPYLAPAAYKVREL